MSAVVEDLLQPVSDPAIWRGADLATRTDWKFELSQVHLAELDAALAGVRRNRLQLAEITAQTFPLPTLSRELLRLRQTLIAGTGFALMRGLAVGAYPLEDLETVYWGLCAHVGTGITQNSDAGLIHYVTDGRLRPGQGTRGVGSPLAAGLHVDLTDCVSLLCVRQAPDDPPSRVASAMLLFNQLVEQCPDVITRLTDGFIWDRKEEQGPGESPTTNYRVPLFSKSGSQVSCRFNRNWIETGSARAGKPVTAQERQIFDIIDELTFKHCFEFPFHPGDIQFCNNYVVMHGREAHAPIEQEAHKRLLLRIWLDLPRVRNFLDEGLIRYGVIRHGQLGWRAADLAAGRNTRGHVRRADGVPALTAPAGSS